MLRASRLLRAGQWQGEPADIVELDFLERHRRRVRLTGAKGLSFMLDLEKAVVLQEGDALLLSDGRLIAVRARPERVIEASGNSPAELARFAWHIGNRHLPAEIGPNSIRLRHDHVIADMLRGLGALVRECEAPFNPEAGAYAGGHSHDHDHLAEMEREHAHDH